MLPRENYLFGCTRSKSNQSSVPADLTIASDFSFVFNARWVRAKCCVDPLRPRRYTAQWWRRHWERTDILQVDVCDAMPDGWQTWLDWVNMIAPDNQSEIKALEADRGTNLAYVRLVGRRQYNVKRCLGGTETDR
jgi:hypothetical protein